MQLYCTYINVYNKMTCYRHTNAPRAERRPREIARHFSGGVARKSSRSRRDEEENEGREKTRNDERRNIKTFRGRRRRCCERTKVWAVGTLFSPIYSFPYNVSTRSRARRENRGTTRRESGPENINSAFAPVAVAARGISGKKKKKRDKINRFLSASYHRRKCCCFALVFLGHNVI